MTCIAGLVHEKEVYMCGDSGHFSAGGLMWRGAGKLRASSPYLFGVSGTTRIGTVIKHEFEPPEPSPADTGEALADFMATTFVRSLRACLRSAGCLVVVNNQESADDSRIMVGVHGQLFLVDSHFGIVRCVERFAAIGSGEDYAAAVLYDLVMLAGETIAPEEIVARAVKSAAHLCSSVCKPIYWTDTKDYIVREVTHGG